MAAVADYDNQNKDKQDYAARYIVRINIEALLFKLTIQK